MIRTRKELIYLNIKDLTDEEVKALEDGLLADEELNCCDKCGAIDSTYKLHWIDSEEFWDDEKVMEYLKKTGNIALCSDCKDKISSE